MLFQELTFFEFPYLVFDPSIDNTYKTGGNMKFVMVTVLPPMRSSMAPKLGRLSPMIRRNAIKHVLNKHLLQVKTEKFSKRQKSAAFQMAIFYVL